MKRTYMLFGMTFLFSFFLLTVNAWGAPYISFNSNRTGQTDIYIIDTNGKNLRNLTNHPAEAVAQRGHQMGVLLLLSRTVMEF